MNDRKGENMLIARKQLRDMQLYNRRVADENRVIKQALEAQGEYIKRLQAENRKLRAAMAKGAGDGGYGRCGGKDSSSAAPPLNDRMGNALIDRGARFAERCFG